MYGLPEQIVSDNGPQFVSEDFAVFLKINGIKHTRSAPYHPSTNGLAERFVQSMKQALKASVGNGLSLSQRLCNFLLMYRSSPHSTTGVSPSSLFLKREVRTRFDLLRPDRELRVLNRQAQQKKDHDHHSRFRQFSVNQRVMVKNFRPGPDWIPAMVVERLGPLSYLVETDDRKLLRRHVDHLKELVTPQDHIEPSATSIWTPRVPITEPTCEPDANDTAELPREELEQPASVSGNVPDSSATHSPTRVKIYPRRHHMKPNYYRPGIDLITLV